MDEQHRAKALTFTATDDPEVVTVDLDRLLTTRLLIQANSGGGKSWAIRYLLEQTHGRIQQIVIDLEGEFATLREVFPYVLAGADEGADVPLSIATAGVLARRLVELHASAIVDLSEVAPDDRQHIVHAILDALLHLPRDLWRPLLVVVDEAHIFCPERGSSPAKAAVINACTRGRKRGQIVCLATQRLALLAKSAAAELNNVLIGRTRLALDLARIGDDLGLDKAERGRLKGLRPGTFYAMGPAFRVADEEVGADAVLIQTGAVRTTHPEPGVVLRAAPPIPTGMEAILRALGDLGGDAGDDVGDDDLVRARHRIRELERQVAELRGRQVDPALLSLQIAAATASLEARIAAQAEQLDRVRNLVAELQGVVAPGEELSVMPQQPAAFLPPPMPAPKQRTDEVARPAPPAKERRRPRPAPTEPSPDLSAPQQRILRALLIFHALGLAAVDRSNVAVWSDQSPTSGGFQNNLGKLRSLGLIDYPRSGQVALTEAGRRLVSTDGHERPLTLEALHDRWCNLLSGPQGRMLRTVIEAHPKALPRDEVAVRSGQSATSGGYQNNLGKLRSLGLIDYPKPGWVVATVLLFPPQFTGTEVAA